MKGIAIGLSNNSKEILQRLKKTEFVKDIYIAGSSKDNGKKNESIKVQKPREILLKKWQEIDLIIFIGSIAASIRIINSFLTSKDQDPGVIVIDNKCSKIVPLIGLHQSNTQNIAFQIANLLDQKPGLSNLAKSIGLGSALTGSSKTFLFFSPLSGGLMVI